MPKVEIETHGNETIVICNRQVVASIKGPMRNQAATALASCLLCNPTATQSEVSDHPSGVRYENQWER